MNQEKSLTDQDDLSTEEFIAQYREPTEAELEAYKKIYQRGPNEPQLREMAFLLVGIMVGGLIMGACWLVSALG